MHKIISKKSTHLAKKYSNWPDQGSKPIAAETSYPVEEVLEVLQDENNNPLFLHVKLGYSSGNWWVRHSDWVTESEDWPHFPKLESSSLSPKQTKTSPPQTPIYFSQLDNYRDALRTCFSSSSAMLLKFYKPDAIQSDDDYIKTVFEIGDTTKANVQLEALSRYGLKCGFSMEKSILWLIKELEAGRPVVCGLLHRGPLSRPSGFGHYVLAYAYEPAEQVVMTHDPNGKYDWKKGRYMHESGHSGGSSQRWPLTVYEKRWTVEATKGNPDCGWALYAVKN